MGQRVLLVEDVRKQALQIVLQLAQLGLEVLVAEQPEAAVRLACSAPPELILIDRELPEEGGRRTCQLLKQEPRTAHIPIVFLSSFYGTLDILLRHSQLGALRAPEHQEVTMVQQVVRQLAALPEYHR